MPRVISYAAYVIAFMIMVATEIPAQKSTETPPPVMGLEAGTLESTGFVSTQITRSAFDDGTRREGPDAGAEESWSLISSGLTIAYGVSPTVGVRLSWLPGFVFYSRYTEDANRRRSGASNLRLDTPLRVLSASRDAGSFDADSTALIGRAPIDLTFTPVGIIRIPGYDLENQSELRQQGEPYVAEHPDIKANALGFALGERLPLGPRAALSAGQEILFYFPADYEEQSLANYDTNLVRDGIDGAEPYDTIYYRYRLTGDVGGSYLLQDFPRNRWTAGLSVGGHFMPAPIVDDILVENTDSFLVSIEPSIAVEPQVWSGRSEFELSWSIPLVGKNEDATHEIALAFRTTLYRPGGDDRPEDESDAGDSRN